jgi:hypothetical protein
MNSFVRINDSLKFKAHIIEKVIYKKGFNWNKTITSCENISK